MDWDKILTWANLIYIIGGAVVAAVPMIIALVKAVKARFNAKTDADKEAAKAELFTNLQSLVAQAEETYASVDKVLKAEGSSAGVLKKDIVLTKLKAVAMDNGFAFDEEYWSEKLEELVALTKKVNAKE